MADEWPTIRLSDVVERVGMGPFGSSIKVETFVPDGVPVISGQHVRGYRVDSGGGFNYVTEEHADRLRNATVHAGDVVLAHRGNIGDVALVPWDSAFPRYVISQSHFYVRCDPSKLLPEFLVAYFKAPSGRHQLLANTSQVGVPSIAQPVTYLRRLEIPLPPLDEQQRIAELLGRLIDKVELNRRMIDTLEAMARALFKSWFADFGPVRAKAEGRSPGVSQSIAELFPDAFDDSAPDEIPVSWVPTTLADFARLNPESWSVTNRPETLRYVDLSNTKWGRIDAITNHLAATAPSRAQRVLRPGDTIIGTVRPGNGSYALVTEEGLTGSTGFAVLRPTRAEFTEFVYLAATDGENIEALAHLADGAAYPAVRPEVVLATPTVRAPLEIVARFSDVARPILRRMAAGHAEAQTLASLRDTILPKLISGEIRVPQIELLLEAAPA
jgi:type I restriction enzyme S subunit